jgi:3-oxoacyl-[acyl-carrier protein] reductase
MGRLDGKVALVTGGGTGIGRATSLLLASEGADVAVNYSRSRTEAEGTAAEIRAAGRNSIAIRADVAVESVVREMVDRVAEELGRLDILVNNAGTTVFVPLADLEALTDEAWDPVFDVNVKGAFYCARAAISKMPETGGQIVNVASIAGTSGQGSSIAYCASKAALISLTKSLAISQAPRIRTNAVAPGVVNTRWVKGWDEFVRANREATPLKRVAEPHDIANAILSLIINEYVTGQVMVVDGGKTI